MVAREVGRRLAYMLEASGFSRDEKEALAFLVPEMTPPQLQQFERLLDSKVTDAIRAQLEELIVAIKAAQHERDLSMSALAEQAHQALDKIEQDLKVAA